MIVVVYKKSKTAKKLYMTVFENEATPDRIINAKARKPLIPNEYEIVELGMGSSFIKWYKDKHKIKKHESLNLNLEKNVDILNYISNHNSMRPELVIGFAAETNNVERNAEKKLNNKNCDWIIANDVSNKKIGFSSDFNEVTIYYKDKNKEKLSYKKKSEISDEIVDRIINQLN